MTEEKRDCTNCGNGIICACTAFNQWQPIAQEKPVEKIQMTEEQARELFSDIGLVETIDMAIDESKKHGYISKSAVEEAEEIIEKIKNFWEKHDQPYELVLKELTSFEIAINQLKSENERLKK